MSCLRVAAVGISLFNFKSSPGWGPSSLLAVGVLPQECSGQWAVGSGQGSSEPFLRPAETVAPTSLPPPHSKSGSQIYGAGRGQVGPGTSLEYLLTLLYFINSQ